MIKDLEKSSVEFNHIKEQKDKIAQELQVKEMIYLVPPLTLLLLTTFLPFSLLPPTPLPSFPPHPSPSPSPLSPQEADAIIDELKEQVDVALGAEEMVEKLTDTNLELEEKIEALNETVADLEALRDLSEEQEELRMEVEHDLREELDLSLNSVRQVGVV